MDEGTSLRVEQDSRAHGHGCVGKDDQVHTRIAIGVVEDQEMQLRIKGKGVVMQRDIISTNHDALTEGNLRMKEDDIKRSLVNT